MRRLDQGHDLSGQRFGRWTVISRGESFKTPSGVVRAGWVCRCACGIERNVRAISLVRKQSQSCGCAKKNAARIVGHQNRTHGESVKYSQTPRYYLWASAKYRAKRIGVPFEIMLDDVIIPTHCPVLGLELRPSVRRMGPSPCSPTIDRLIPERGYVTDNIRVISWRANSLKSNASLDELRCLVAYLEREVDRDCNRARDIQSFEVA